MARNEHQPQHIVTDRVIHGSRKIGYLHFLLGHLAAEIFVFAVNQRTSSQIVDRSMFRRAHEPGSGIIRDPRLWPFLQRNHQGILRQFFGDSHVPDEPSQPGNHSGRLDPPHGFYSVMDIGSAHSYRSHHVQTLLATSRSA